MNKTRIRPAYESLNKLAAGMDLSRRIVARGMHDGEFRSPSAGRSMELRDLRPYNPGDNMRDIDWKASSRMGEVYVRNHEAARRHRLIIITDTGTNMQGTTPSLTSKADTAILTTASIAYMCGRAGADYSMITGRDMAADSFGCGPVYLERHLQTLEKEMDDSVVQTDTRKKTQLISRLPMAINGMLGAGIRGRGCVTALVTDLYGIVNLSDDILTRLARGREAYIFMIDDVDPGRCDIYDTATGKPIPGRLSYSRFINKRLSERKFELVSGQYRRLAGYGIQLVIIRDDRDIPFGIAHSIGHSS